MSAVPSTTPNRACAPVHGVNETMNTSNMKESLMEIERCKALIFHLRGEVNMLKQNNIEMSTVIATQQAEIRVLHHLLNTRETQVSQRNPMQGAIMMPPPTPSQRAVTPNKMAPTPGLTPGATSPNTQGGNRPSSVVAQNVTPIRSVPIMNGVSPIRPPAPYALHGSPNNSPQHSPVPPHTSLAGQATGANAPISPLLQPVTSNLLHPLASHASSVPTGSMPLQLQPTSTAALDGFFQRFVTENPSAGVRIVRKGGVYSINAVQMLVRIDDLGQNVFVQPSAYKVDGTPQDLSEVPPTCLGVESPFYTYVDEVTRLLSRQSGVTHPVSSVASRNISPAPSSAATASRAKAKAKSSAISKTATASRSPAPKASATPQRGVTPTRTAAAKAKSPAAAAKSPVPSRSPAVKKATGVSPAPKRKL